MYRCPPYQPGDLCRLCPHDGDNCPNWTPWGNTFDTVRAAPEVIAAKAIIKEVERVRKAHAKMTTKGKVSKASVNLRKLADKHHVSSIARVAQAAMDQNATVQQVAKMIRIEEKLSSKIS